MIVAVSLTMKLWHNQEEAQQLLVGLALVPAMPIAGASTAWAQNANGSVILSLGLVLLTTLLSPLTITDQLTRHESECSITHAPRNVVTSPEASSCKSSE
jgi:hypothetical protein